MHRFVSVLSVLDEGSRDSVGEEGFWEAQVPGSPFLPSLRLAAKRREGNKRGSKECAGKRLHAVLHDFPGTAGWL